MVKSITPMLLIFYLLMVVTGTAKGGFTMATINVTTNAIRVWSNGDSIRYRLQTNEEFDGITKNGDTYQEAKINYVDFVPRYLIAQVLSLIPGADIIYTKKKEQSLRSNNEDGFGAAEIQALLRGAKLTLERVKFEAGDEYTTADGEVMQHTYAGYNTEIVDIQVSDRIREKLDDLFDSILGF